MNDTSRESILLGHRTAFETLRTEALDAHARGRHLEAATRAQMAATYAYFHHGGIWASPQLERMLMTIGREVLDRPLPPRERPHGAPIERVLHVLTRVASIGGHSRMLWRWVSQDDRRSHSVVLTRQGALPIPDDLLQATLARGGTVRSLNRTRGDTLTWARDLREMAAGFDLVVLHIFAEDAIPVIAFGERAGLPPIAFVDQADHAFSIGAGTADLYIPLRESGARLAMERRGVAAERVSDLLPITLPLIERTQDRAQAKRQLGWAEDSVVMLSIARAPKFRAFEGRHFASTFRELLVRHPQLMLVVVGPGDDEVWRELGELTGGRAIALAETPDTKRYYEAADIYLDSFPVISNTSLLEAGSHEVPLVSRCRQPGEHTIFCADAPGFAADIARTSDVGEYIASIEALVLDAELRERIGRTTRESIVDAHVGSGWQRYLERIYEQARHVPGLTAPPDADDDVHEDELDLIWSESFASEVQLDDVRSYHVKGLPLRQRIGEVVGLSRRRRKLQPQLLFPEWITASLRELSERVRR